MNETGADFLPKKRKKKKQLISKNVIECIFEIESARNDCFYFDMNEVIITSTIRCDEMR